MNLARMPIGWTHAERVGRFYCPAYRPNPRETELLPITLDTARRGQLTCSKCGEALARANGNVLRRFA